MYCHWALHVDLDSPKTTTDFLQRVDTWVTNRVAHLTPSGPWKFTDEVQLFRDFLYLQTLRRELASFLNAYSLPTALCDDDRQWFAFLTAYAGVIEDGTLSMKANKSLGLEAVQRVTFRKGETLPPDNHVNFVIQWDIELKDGRVLKTEFEAQPKEGVTISKHHLQLVGGTSVPPVVTPQAP